MHRLYGNKIEKSIFNITGRVMSFLLIIRRFNGIILINMAALALGLASVIFIATWVSHELSYDRWHEKHSRIYRIESLLDFTGEPFVWNVAPAPVAAALPNDFPEVEDAVNFYTAYRSSFSIGEEVFNVENAYYTTNAVFRIFSFDLLLGNPETALTDPNALIISESTARKFFGAQNPVGKSVLFNNEDLLIITGIMKDLPFSSHIKINYLLSWNLLVKKGKKLDTWDQYDYYTYALLKENVDPDEFNSKLAGYLKTKKENAAATLFINPLTRIFLYRDPGLPSIKYPAGEKEPITMVILFTIIGVAILMIAVINFINLSTAFASERAKEIGIRKVNGAARSNLVIQFFKESFLQTLIALIAALLIVIFLMPVFIRITNGEFTISFLFEWKNILIYLLLGMVTAVLSGFYSAVVLSRFSPLSVLKVNPDSRLHGSGLRKVLVIIQFALSIIFIFCVMVMKGQIKFMQNQELGFNAEDVMVIYPEEGIEKVNIIAEEIRKIPGVNKVAIGGNVPLNMGNWNTYSHWDGNTSGKTLKFYEMQVDDRYFDLLGFELSEGRNLTRGAPRYEALINESAVRMMEIEDPIGKRIKKEYDNMEYEIVGMVKDFHFKKLSEEIQPIIMFKSTDWFSPRLFIKLGPVNTFEIVDRISNIVSESIPGFPVRYIFLDEEIEKYYNEERRLNSIINLAALLSIVISVIGLFSLTAFTIRRKSKEVGIRKVHGASSGRLAIMLQGQFGTLIIIASVIALPCAYYIITRWLETYAYHIKIHPVYFILTFLTVVIIALVTILFHTLRTANLNPVDTLKDE